MDSADFENSSVAITKLRAARAELGTETIKDTVNLALQRAGAEHRTTVKQGLDVLARSKLQPRERAWR